MKIWLYAILAVVLAFSAYAVTLVSPATSGVLGAGTYLNATMTGMNGSKNCTFYAYSASTANSSYIQIGSNATVSAANISEGRTVRFAQFVLEDASDYVFQANCTNDSTNWYPSSTSTGVTVDGTIPQAPSSPSFGTNEVIRSSKAITYSVTAGNTTACTLYIGTKSFAMTEASGVCSYTLTKLSGVLDGTYDVYAIATDQYNTSTSSVTSKGLTVQLQEEVADDDTEEIAQEQAKKNNTAVIILVGALVVYLLFFHKKK